MGKMLIEYIKPSILEKHLNNCVQNKLCDTNVVLQIDYRFLAPPTKITTNETEQHTDDVEPGTTTTDVIYYMSTSTRLKHLIRHPVIATFLLRKWENWNNIFIINIIVYVCFLVPIIIFVILNITPIILIISLVLLLLREGCEYIGTKTSYLERYDNLLELLISIMLILMVFLQLIYEGEIQLSSILILLAAFEFMIVLSIAPNCSTNMAIFSTVLVNYFIFLLWYSVLLIAFTYSFYSLFECQNTSFVNLTESFFKIIIMMTGELDAGNIKFDMHPLIGKTIFALFIFMIPIVLLNLLNGLAINDIQIIKQNAELTGYATLAYNIQIAETLIYKYKINCIKKLFFKEVKPIFDNTYQLTVNENKGSNDNQSKHSWWVFWKNPVGIEIMELVQTQNEKQGLDIDIIDIRKTLSEILSVLKPPFQNSCNLGERPTLQAGSQGPVHEPDPQAGPSGVCGAYNI
ncbi:transient receptor potential cation channel protein painless-like [Sitophilus oryzae]|uniref:Transient receptor potential cation channel protein painless-like n=1 Tax=Sitophilus oryzae TaxID=7048 RepID=A0A6J2Y9W5_SITOR|nr:transient receptor potential cation channel protein painless-like [Sitophilus oryzae]